MTWKVCILQTDPETTENGYPLWYLRFKKWNEIETFTKKAPWQKVTISDAMTWVKWQVQILQTENKSLISVIREEVGMQQVLATFISTDS